MLIFAEWNLPQRFFRAPPLFGGKKSKILENRVGKIAFYKVQGHILGLFARFGTRFFFSIFFREIRIFSRKKIASRATKMLERAFISQGKVKSALVARETCNGNFAKLHPYFTRCASGSERNCARILRKFRKTSFARD